MSIFGNIMSKVFGHAGASEGSPSDASAPPLQASTTSAPGAEATGTAPVRSGAQNVDVAAVGVRVLRFEAAEPQDSSDNRIAPGRIRDQDFARAPAIFEHRSARSGAANLLRDFEFAQRCCLAARRVTDREL